MEMQQPLNGGRDHGKIERDVTSPIPDPEMTRPGRRGCNPFRAFVIMLRSSSSLGACTNVLLPFVPVGLLLHWWKPDLHLWIFLTNYLAMIPMANLLAFSSAQFSRRLPRVLGVIIQLTFASSVEVILCLVLLFKSQFQVIQAALLGSMLANLLLCTGLCFIVGGIRTKAQEFSETVVETGGGLLLVSVASLMLPCAFFESVSAMGRLPQEELDHKLLHISRFSAVLLLIAYVTYLFFQLATHHSEFDQALYESEQRNKDRADNIRRENLTIGEAAFLTFMSLAFVTLHAVFLVEQIHWIVSHKHVSDAFMGLILVPLVEKAAEHLKGIDEAWDDAMDFALSHLLGSTIQTALLVSPIIVLVGWAAHKPFNLNFEVFMVIALVFSVLIVGNFIKDRKSNYLEGALCVIFYIMIAVTTWYYPSPEGMEEEH
ncbi:Sodium/calcium exchanger protein-domain-containing protein [Tuber indicum]|nr:Sodium/calcium exchanger protein-domain-containing protein [Tuber indicum]